MTKQYRHLLNTDIVRLVYSSQVPSGKNIRLREGTKREEDIFDYLINANSDASVEELGMNLEMLWEDLVVSLRRLERGGYIKIIPTPNREGQLPERLRPDRTYYDTVSDTLKHSRNPYL